MTPSDILTLQQRVQHVLIEAFAQEDDALRFAVALAKQHGLPAIQISPLQGKFLQFLAAACHAHYILEIGALAGYSAIWLARALPADGRLITLEINPLHVALTRQVLARAGLAERVEVREGNALDLLPDLIPQAPFDLIFIDADKKEGPAYLDRALTLSRPGTIIVADNSLPGGSRLRFPEPGSDEAIVEYTRRLVANPHLVSLALPLDENYTDGFALAVVRQRA
jgi:caffeoyl-CoA O-methyltransferase